MISKFQELIYNEHLKISRVSRNKPYRLRKDFNKVTPSHEVYLNRLSKFFDDYKQIRYQDFFKAPYVIYKDDYFDLKFFTTPKAILAWKIYIKQLVQSDPDSLDMSQWVTEGIDFIHGFCMKNDINLSEYCGHKDEASGINSSVIHLKEHKVPIYVLLNFSQMSDVFENLNETVRNSLFSDDFNATLNMFRIKFSNSEIKNKIKLQLQ